VEKENLKKKRNFLKRIKSQLPVLIGHIKLLVDLLRPFANLLLMKIVITSIQTGFDMLTPQFSGGIIDIVTRSKNVDDLKELAIKMFAFSIIQQEINKFSSKFSQKYSKKINTSLKGEVYKRLLECDMEFFDKISTSEASQIVSPGAERLMQLTFYSLFKVLQTVLCLFGNLYFMYNISPRLTFIILIITPLKYFLGFMN